MRLALVSFIIFLINLEKNIIHAEGSEKSNCKAAMNGGASHSNSPSLDTENFLIIKPTSESQNADLDPQTIKDYKEDGFITAKGLKNWRKKIMGQLLELPEADFLKVLDESIQVHRGDVQFRDKDRQEFLDSMQLWIASKRSGDLSTLPEHQKRILLETESRPGDTSFQPIVADFNNMQMFMERDDGKKIPRAAFPAIMCAFYKRYILPQQQENRNLDSLRASIEAMYE